MQPTISANLIVLNEESHIAECLDALRWADEIIVVDGGSRDRSVQIARQRGARVFDHPFDDFARQRNRAIDASHGDWIVSVDADERITAPLRDEVRKAVGQAAVSTAGFWVPITSHIFGRRFRWTGTQGERKLRLFRRSCGRWTGPVHETVHLIGRVGRLVNPILHYSTPDLATYCRKLVRYVTLEARRARFEPSERSQRSVVHAWLDSLRTFVRLYVMRLGVLDGVAGLQFSALSAWERWLVRRGSVVGNR